MKKLALWLGMLVFTSQLPFCPYRVLPGDLIRSFEYGRQWTGMFLQAYGLSDAPKSQDVPAPTPTLAALAFASMDLPISHVDDLPHIEDLEIHVNIQLDQEAIKLQLEKETRCAMKQLRENLKKIESEHRRVELERHLRTRAVEATRRLEMVRLVLATKPV